MNFLLRSIATPIAAAASLLGVAAIAASAEPMEPVRSFGDQRVISSDVTPFSSAPSGKARTNMRARLLGPSDSKATPNAQNASRSAPKGSARPPVKQSSSQGASQYRTMCVRLCDGFYFPVNEASPRSSFAADEERCRSSCRAPAKLYYMTSSEDDAAGMKALDGTRYADLPNAFRYRSEYVMQCDCKPRPWTQEAKLIFDRRAVIAARSPLELRVAAGAEAMAQVLAEGEVRVARAKPRATQVRQADAAASRAKMRRTTRYGNGFLLAPPQSAGEPRRRRFFLFRNWVGR